MKLRYNLVKGFLLIGMMGFIAAPSFAQIDDVQRILQAGTEDANQLVRAYLKPFGSGFGAGLNTGWTNTAKPHKKLGFDITVSAGLAIVPNTDKTFDVTQLGLQRLEYESGPMESQTINGANEAGSVLAAYYDPDGLGGLFGPEKLIEFTMPNGTGFGYVPAPMLKAGIGLIKNTEVMIRYLPPYENNDFGSFELFGVGVKHGINQWLPAGKLIPVDLSVMVGYTSMDVSSNFRLDAEDVMLDPENTENPFRPTEWDGQSIQLTTDAYTINALVGKTLPMISVYAGVGYEASTLNITTPGSYPTVIPNEAYQSDPDSNEPLIVDKIVDPIDVGIDGDNGFHALAGLRFRFAIFHISASYTLAEYSSYNVGFGISFR